MYGALDEVQAVMAITLRDVIASNESWGCTVYILGDMGSMLLPANVIEAESDEVMVENRGG